VQFFFQPPDGEYFHVALLLRVAKKDDPRWKATEYSDVGRTAYVSLGDMKRFMTLLTRLSLQWDESPMVDSLETYKTIHSYGYGMGIKVLSTNGTAKGLIAQTKFARLLHHWTVHYPPHEHCGSFKAFGCNITAEFPTSTSMRTLSSNVE
jgi:hypothetical protein